VCGARDREVAALKTGSPPPDESLGASSLGGHGEVRCTLAQLALAEEFFSVKGTYRRARGSTTLQTAIAQPHPPEARISRAFGQHGTKRQLMRFGNLQPTQTCRSMPTIKPLGDHLVDRHPRDHCRDEREHRGESRGQRRHRRTGTEPCQSPADAKNRGACEQS
jgi:hypothetical protein